MAINRLSQSTAQSAFPKFTNLWDGTTATSSFDSLGAIVLTSTTATVTFNNIPQTYTHLQLRYIAKSVYNAGNGVDDPNLSFNSDTTYTNYRSHYLEGNGASTYVGAVQTSGTYSLGAGVARSYTGQTNMFASGVADIFEYTTNKYKTIRSMGGADYNGSGEVHFHSSLWMSTSAISRIDITCVAANFAQYSSFALYGIK